MKMLRGRLIQRIKRTPTIESFRFEPEQKLDFAPGQSVRVIFDDTDMQNTALNKYLSLSSSPAKEYIEVTKRLSNSEFSNRLKDLKVDDRVLFKGPLGNCVFKEEYKKIGFLIGGIGITPVISIIEYIVDKGLDTDVHLLYSNRTEEEIAFYKELKDWADAHSNVKVCYTITDCTPQNKICVSGRICKDLFLAKVKDVGDRVFFIFGPPKMVGAMKNLCLGAGVDAAYIKTESFVGY